VACQHHVSIVDFPFRRYMSLVLHVLEKLWSYGVSEVSVWRTSCVHQRVPPRTTHHEHHTPTLTDPRLATCIPSHRVLVFCTTTVKMPHLQEMEAAPSDVRGTTDPKGRIITTIGYLLLKAET
jgi:hypothetical protein